MQQWSISSTGLAPGTLMPLMCQHHDQRVPLFRQRPYCAASGRAGHV